MPKDKASKQSQEQSPVSPAADEELAQHDPVDDRKPPRYGYLEFGDHKIGVYRRPHGMHIAGMGYAQQKRDYGAVLGIVSEILSHTTQDDFPLLYDALLAAATEDDDSDDFETMMDLAMQIQEMTLGRPKGR